jgi:hypothetical protein
MILELFNEHLMVPRRQLPNRPWGQFLTSNRLVLHLPPDISVQSFEGSSGGKRRPVNETERLLRALKKREIKVTPMGSDSTKSGGVRRAADDVGSTNVESSGSDAGSGGVRRAADDVGSTNVEGSGSDAGSGDVSNDDGDLAKDSYNNRRDGSDSESDAQPLTPSP